MWLLLIRLYNKLLCFNQAGVGKNNEELKLLDAAWITVDTEPGYPCRVSLSDAKVGERVLAVSFSHYNVNSPYRASGPYLSARRFQ